MTTCDVPAQRGRIRPITLRGPASAGRRGALLFAVCMAAGACDIPTSLPLFESRWVVPLETTRVPVSELLPAGLTLANNAFRVSIPVATTHRTLGQLCGTPCTTAHGLLVPKPAFSTSFQLVTALPADVMSATITGGVIAISFVHNFGFDPLRPAGRTHDGVIILTVRNGGRVLGSAVIDQSFPTGVQVSRTLVLAPGSIAGALEVSLAITSPAGSPVTINQASTLAVGVMPGVINASDAQIAVQQRMIAADGVDLDLSEVDGALRGRVRRGALQVGVSNPFDVAGQLQLRLHSATSGADILRTVEVGPGSSTSEIQLSLEEVRSLLGHRVSAALAGPVSATAAGNGVTVRPDQELAVTPRLDFIVEIGS